MVATLVLLLVIAAIIGVAYANRRTGSEQQIEIRTELVADHYGLRATEENGGPAFNVDVVGESHYQAALAAIAGGHSKEGARLQTTATLVLENQNRYDPAAVAVYIAGHKIGHLSRENARTYRARLGDLGTPGAQLDCPAIILGGWQRRSNTGLFGVKLDLSKI